MTISRRSFSAGVVAMAALPGAALAHQPAAAVSINDLIPESLKNGPMTWPGTEVVVTRKGMCMREIGYRNEFFLLELHVPGKGPACNWVSIDDDLVIYVHDNQGPDVARRFIECEIRACVEGFLEFAKTDLGP